VHHHHFATFQYVPSQVASIGNPYTSDLFFLPLLTTRELLIVFKLLHKLQIFEHVFKKHVKTTKTRDCSEMLIIHTNEF
jgi:hypothetical protein